MQCLSWEGEYRSEKTKLRTFDDSYIKYDLLWNIVMAEHSTHCAWRFYPLKHWNSTDMSQQFIRSMQIKVRIFFRERKKNTSSKRYDWLTYHDNTRESTASIVSCSPGIAKCKNPHAIGTCAEWCSGRSKICIVRFILYCKTCIILYMSSILKNDFFFK